MPKGIPKAKTDKVNPAHYQTTSGVQAVDVVEAFDLTHHIGTAVIYTLRAGKKPDEPKADDLKKAIWWLNREIDNCEKKTLLTKPKRGPEERGVSPSDGTFRQTKEAKELARKFKAKPKKRKPPSSHTSISVENKSGQLGVGTRTGRFPAKNPAIANKPKF